MTVSEPGVDEMLHATVSFSVIYSIVSELAQPCGNNLAHPDVPAMHAGEMEYWDMFSAAYTAAIRHYKDGPFYPHADIWMGTHTHLQFTSLQAFWPGTDIPCKV